SAARGPPGASARQGDRETWLTSDQASHRRDAGHFARWANRHHLTSLEFPATRWHGPARTIDTETRWAQARWLLHDHTLNPADRGAGLRILLYAQTPPAISRLPPQHAPPPRPRPPPSPTSMCTPPAPRCPSAAAANPSRCPTHSPA